MRRVKWWPFLLIAAYVAQGFWFIGSQSLTYDEPLHLKAGMEMWRYGRFDFDDGHPSAPRMWCALLVISGKFQVEHLETATRFRPSPEAIAWRARLMQMILGVALALLLWSTARRMYSEGAANFALALFVFSPALIAHFCVATTDAAGVLMIFAVPVMMLHWQRCPSGWRTVTLGIVLGLLLGSKFYTLPLFVLAIFWVLVTSSERTVSHPRAWNWRAAGAVAGIAVILVWSSYFFHVSRITLLGDRTVRLEVPGYDQPLIRRVPFSPRATIYVPALEYLAGIGSILDHARRGHSSYFLGELSSTGGWKLYFPVVILLKWPTVVLVLLLIALGIALRGRLPWLRGSLLFYSFPILFLAAAMTSKINIGDRHILPVYPFALLFVGGMWELARKSTRRRILCALLVAAALLMAADTLRCAPDYLSWMNIFVLPEESWRLLADSSLDWGQGLLALRDYQRQHPEETPYLAYYGNVAPEVYGIRYMPLMEGERVHGTVVVSSVFLSGRLLRDPDAYKWLLAHKRKVLLNHSLHVFEVN